MLRGSHTVLREGQASRISVTSLPTSIPPTCLPRCSTCLSLCPQLYGGASRENAPAAMDRNGILSPDSWLLSVGAVQQQLTGALLWGPPGRRRLGCSPVFELRREQLRIPASQELPKQEAPSNLLKPCVDRGCQTPPRPSWPPWAS